MSDLKTFITLCSGRGSNFKALLEAYERNDLNAKPIALISSSSTAKALEIAKSHGLRSFVLPEESTKNRDLALIELITDLVPDFIVLSGYLKLIPQEVITRFPSRIINIHPSLLPKHGGQGMYGLKVHRSVLEAKDIRTGASVHLVTEKFDEGPVIMQSEIVVKENESAEELAARVLEIEHVLFPKAINKFVTSLT